MDTLQLLGAALGLATLAGINLYLTVFVTGLAIQQHWIVLSTQYQGLAVLGEPAILIVAGVLYLIEFFADKIPGVDSAWDLVHTAIRPIGGAFLALKVLGSADPVFDVIVALLAGGVTLTAHSAKAGTRLLVNSSPEPFSNIAVSFAEDVGVVGGLWLVGKHPAIAFVVFTCLIATILYWLPKLFRFARIKFGFLWKKLSAAGGEANAGVSADLPSEAALQLAALNTSSARPEWAVACVTGGGKGLPSHGRVYLVALEGASRALWVVGRVGWKKIAQRLDLSGYQVTRESKFLSENLVFFATNGRPKYTFLFDRTQSARVQALVARLKTALPAPAALTPALAEVASV